MDSPAGQLRQFSCLPTREEYLRSHLVRFQVKVPQGNLGQLCFVKVGTDSIRVFPGDQREKSIFFCEFYSRKAEETVTVFFRQPDGKDVFDSPKKRTIKCTSDGGKKLFGGGDELPANPKFTHYEWLWGLNASVCRLIVEEPRLQPHDSSTAVICFAYDPEDISPSAAPAPPAPASPDVGAGRGTGREIAPPGGGRGLARRDTMDGTGRGRGRGEPGSPALQRRPSGSLAPDADTVGGGRRRASSGAGDLDVIRPGLPAANSVVDACVMRYVELCNTQPQGSHVIICTGGAQERQQVDSGSEVLAKRIVAHAVEKKHNTVLYKDILQEPYANNEFYMFCNLRLLLTRSGVAKCVIVARDVDIERLLMLWTANMVGLKISISTLPVPTPEDRAGKAKREAMHKAAEVLEEIKKSKK